MGLNPPIKPKQLTTKAAGKTCHVFGGLESHRRRLKIVAVCDLGKFSTKQIMLWALCGSSFLLVKLLERWLGLWIIS